MLSGHGETQYKFFVTCAVSGEIQVDILRHHALAVEVAHILLVVVAGSSFSSNPVHRLLVVLVVSAAG